MSITLDNASVNNVLIQELEHMVEGFPGEANQTRCFNHILSLVAKSIVQMFDVPKNNADGELSGDEALLQTLAEGIELEERET